MAQVTVRPPLAYCAKGTSMSPSLQETYEAVVRAMNNAVRDPNFGELLMLSGMGREDWLTAKIAQEFPADKFNVRVQQERVDIGIVDKKGCVQCAIEAKFFFRYECKV